MRNRILIFIIAAAVLLAATFASAGQSIKMTGPKDAQNSAANPPQAVFPEKEYVFAPIYEGAQIRHAFVVENKGTVPLVIKNVRPD